MTASEKKGYKVLLKQKPSSDLLAECDKCNVIDVESEMKVHQCRK